MGFCVSCVSCLDLYNYYRNDSKVKTWREQCDQVYNVEDEKKLMKFARQEKNLNSPLWIEFCFNKNLEYKVDGQYLPQVACVEYPG